MKKRFTNDFRARVTCELLKEEKTLSQLSAEHGVAATQLSQWKATVIKGLPSLFEDEHKGIEAVRLEYEWRTEELYSEIGRLTTQLAWLKKNMVLKLSRAERVKRMEWENGELSVKLQTELLGLNRTSLYYRPIAPSAEELALKNRIDEIYTAHPFFGSRKLVTVLGWAGIHINRKAVQRHMQEMGIAGIVPGPNLSKRRAKTGIFPYLLRGVTIECPNQVFGIDITYIRIQHGWMYLVAILDWYSRYVVAWELDQTLEIDFVLSAVDRALSVAIPTIINSDQGSLLSLSKDH